MANLFEILGIDLKTLPDVKFEFIGTPYDFVANSGATIYEFYLVEEIREISRGYKNASNVKCILAGSSVIEFLLQEEKNGEKIFEWTEIGNVGIGKLSCKGVFLDISQSGDVWLVKKGESLSSYPKRKRNILK